MDLREYITTLVKPSANGKRTGRRIWSIDLETVWLPFFTATNVEGKTAIPDEALGAPLRLQYEADGSVKFSKTGRPVIKVAKEVSEQVRLVRENLIASLTTYANSVAMENPDAYQSQIDSARRAGEPIVNHDKQKLSEALAQLEAKARAEAQAKSAPKARAEAKAKEAVTA